MPPNNEYRLLIEFVHKHLDFHNPELISILEMHNIKIGRDCHFLPLPNESICSVQMDGKKAHSLRPFRILSFSFDAIGEKFSVCEDFGSDDVGTKSSVEDLPKNSPSRCKLREESAITKRNCKRKNAINLVAALSRCTLIRSVTELWGSGPNLDECVADVKRMDAMQRHRAGKHLYPLELMEEEASDNVIKRNKGLNASSNLDDTKKSLQDGTVDTATNIDTNESFVRNFVRSWKITVHTLGSTYTRDEQNMMRSKFAFLNFPGDVQMDNPDDEFLLIREIELDSMGGAIYPRHRSGKGDLIAENDARPPLACYFGRLLGNKNLGRNWRSSRVECYSLKKRIYLGPTSMDSELSLIMTNLALIKNGSFVFDPFVGTGSILLTAALRGSYTFGTDIDLRVLRGRSQKENIESNFRQYGLAPPELVRSDNAIYHRHFRNHLPMFDAIVTDPPYGIRAGARKSGSKKEGEIRPILDEHRYDHVAQTRPYIVSDVMADLLNVAAMTLVMGGRLVFVIPSMLDFDEDVDLPRHDCLRRVHVCYQPLQTELGRRTVTMEKIKEYDENKKHLYIEQTWVNGPQSAEKVANIRERLLEAAKKKPGYEEKAALRKLKRKATKEAKKRAKKEALIQNHGDNRQVNK